MTRLPLVVVKRALPDKPVQPHAADRHDYTPKQKMNPLAFAQFWLGRRLTERTMPDGSVGTFLDGSPVKLDAIMREANRAARLAGQTMLSINPRWVPA